MSTVTAGISVHDLHKRLHEKNEFALLDVREQEEFSRSHILLACCVPLSRLELSVEALVPCQKTAVFVMDDGRSQDLDRSARAAAALTGMGYQDVSIVTGGLEAWEAAGFVTVNGVGALSKGFGEYVEEVQHTPRLTPEEIKALLDDPDERTIVIDVRPVNEYRNMNIPGSTNLPGCEVTYRLAEVVKDPDTTIIINCAGRTRSIIGTQTLINAGVPNRVVALKGGTMNWQLSGFDLEYGSPRPVPPSTEEGRRVAAQRIRQVAETYLVLRDASGALMLLDQHAAHERVLYERLRKGAFAGTAQCLALPLELALQPVEEERFLEVRDNLERMGFDVSCSGGRLLARGIPPSLSRSEAGEFLREVLAGRKDDIRAMFISLSCKGAIKAGQRLADDEAAALLRQWLHTPEREYCPHGRPSILRWDAVALEKLFKRRQ